MALETLTVFPASDRKSLECYVELEKEYFPGLGYHLSLGGERWGIVLKIRQAIGIPSLIQHNLI